MPWLDGTTTPRVASTLEIALKTTGAPVAAAPVGTLYLRTDAAANQLYVKETGSSTTGWQPVATSSGVFNVKDYGAIGDGVTADYAAIAAAVAAAGVAGGVVYFPPGTYLVSTSIIVPSNVRIVGCDKNSSIVQKSANIILFSFTGASNASRCQRGGMMDIKLVGNGFTGALVQCKWADHLNFDRVWMFNNPDVMLYTENLWDTYFNNVEFDTAIGSDGLKPSVLITSNADDSSNVIVFSGCRWENFCDGAMWISSRTPVSAFTMVTGTNPPYGITVQNSKWETPQLRGTMFDMSSDVSDVHLAGMYVAARGLYSGVVTGKVLFGIGAAYDISFERMKILINGSVNPTVSDAFYIFTNATNLVLRDIQFDAQQNPSASLITIGGGQPDILIENVSQRAGQTATMMTGTWPPAVASATTTTLLALAPVQTITGATTITSITAQAAGRIVTLRFTSTAQVTDGSNLKLAATFTGGADRTLTLMSDGTNWVELARSTN